MKTPKGMTTPQGWGAFGSGIGRSVAVGGLLLVLALTGCSSGPQEMSYSTPDSGAMVVDDRAAKKISDEDLTRMRFRELWSYKHAGTIEQLWYLGGNLYMTTRGSAGNHKLLKVSGDSGLVEWTFDLQGRLEFRPTVFEYPAELQAGTFRELFVIQNDDIHCLDDEVGLEVYEIDTGVSISTPCEASPTDLFVGTWDHRVYAFGKSSRIEEWTYLTDGPIVVPPTVGKLNVYFASEDGNLYCLNGGGGWVDGESWVHRTGGKIVTRPLFYKDRAYVGSWDYKLYCLEEFRGLVRWAYPAGAPVVGDIFPFRDSVYATVREDRDPSNVWTGLVRTSDDDGQPQWERKGFQRVVGADAIHCFALDNDGELHACRQTDGMSDWSVDLSRYAFVLGQDARQSADRASWGKMIVATRDGVIQCIQPRR